jgi:hypothetical protein
MLQSRQQSKTFFFNSRIICLMLIKFFWKEWDRSINISTNSYITCRNDWFLHKILFKFVQPLTHLLRKDSKFIWSENCQQAFKNSKSLLMKLYIGIIHLM